MFSAYRAANANLGVPDSDYHTQASKLGLRSQREYEKWRAGRTDASALALPLKPDEVYALSVRKPGRETNDMFIIIAAFPSLVVRFADVSWVRADA